MANSLSYQEAERLIRENPRQADALAFESQEYFKTHPDVTSTDLPKSVLDGKAISEAYSYLRERHEDLQMNQEGSIDQTKIPPELGGLPVLAAAFFERPKIMEDDGDYHRIQEKLKKDWLKENNAKDFMSKEGLDYLYGSDLRQQTRDAFRKDPRNAKKVEKYDKEKKKIYKKYQDDPVRYRYQNDMMYETSDRLALLEKTNKGTKLSKEEISAQQDEITRQIHGNYLKRFARENPEKVKTYHEIIKAERVKREVLGQKETNPKFSFYSPYTQPSSVTAESPTSGQTHPITSSSSQPGTKIKNPSRGLRGSPKLNSLPGPKMAGKKGLTSFLAANPWVWIILGIIVLIIIVFIIVVSGTSGGAPGVPTVETTPAPTSVVSPIPPLAP